MRTQRSVLAGLFLFALACGSTETITTASRLTLAGSSTIQPIIEDAAPLFEKKKARSREVARVPVLRLPPKERPISAWSAAP
jgi:ABC-type phosphate transport system substrate-binding protein